MQLLDDDLTPAPRRCNVERALDMIKLCNKSGLLILLVLLALIASIHFSLLDLNTANFMLDVAFYAFMPVIVLVVYSIYLFHKPDND